MDFIVIKNDNACFSGQSSEGPCILNALKIFHLGKLEGALNVFGRYKPSQLSLQSKVYHCCPVNLGESSGSPPLFPCKNNRTLLLIRQWNYDKINLCTVVYPMLLQPSTLNLINCAMRGSLLMQNSNNFHRHKIWKL